MSRALFDVNVLLALFDPDHIHHDRARRWLDAEVRHGWASCAITQNGFVRIASQPAYPGRRTPREAIDRLERATSTDAHEYWDCSVSVTEQATIDRSRILGAKQLTDGYLLALAANHNGRLVTFDGGVPLSAVPAATENHIVIL